MVTLVVHRHPGLGGQHDVVAAARDGAADHFLRFAAAVHVRGVDEVDPASSAASTIAVASSWPVRPILPKFMAPSATVLTCTPVRHQARPGRGLTVRRRRLRDAARLLPRPPGSGMRAAARCGRRCRRDHPRHRGLRADARRGQSVHRREQQSALRRPQAGRAADRGPAPELADRSCHRTDPPASRPPPGRDAHASFLPHAGHVNRRMPQTTIAHQTGTLFSMSSTRTPPGARHSRPRFARARCRTGSRLRPGEPRPATTRVCRCPQVT